MIPASFDYSSPATLAGALKLLADNPGSKILAGGQSLIPILKLRLAQPAHLVDLGRIAGLNHITQQDGVIRIGAMTTHHQVETSPLLRESCPLLAMTAGHIGDVQVRNRGTIGGSLAHADPAADYPAALLALEAKVKLAGAAGERLVAIDEFLVDTMTTALEPGEIITELQVPAESAGVGVAYRTIIQPASGFAIVGVAVRLGVSGGKVTLARVGVTGISFKPYRAAAVEQALEGAEASADAFAAAAQHAADGVDGLTDLHASAEYRSHLAVVQVRRALEDAARR